MAAFLGLYDRFGEQSLVPQLIDAAYRCQNPNGRSQPFPDGRVAEVRGHKCIPETSASLEQLATAAHSRALKVVPNFKSKFVGKNLNH